MLTIQPAHALPLPPYVRVGTSRKLRNACYRMFYRWSHSDAFRHNERIWRDVSVQRDAADRLATLSIAGTQIALANAEPYPSLHNRTAHLIATGQSVNEIDYAALDIPHALGVNGAIALQERYPVRFDHYCIIDAGFVKNRPDLTMRVLRENLLLFTTPLVLWHIAQFFPLARMRCRIFLIENVLFPVRRRALSMRELFAGRAREDLVAFDEKRALGFSLNIRRGAFDSHTVAYTGLQALVSLGYSTIYLHGIDMQNAAHTPRFYETREAMQPTALDAQFSSAIEPSFRHAAALLKARGIDVVNLSAHSRLGADIFEKRPWQSLR